MRSVLEVDLGKIVSNYNKYKSYLNSDIVAVVKANAYGVGSVAVAHTLSDAGCSRFALASISEAMALRKEGIVGQMIILSDTTDNVEVLSLFELNLCVGSLERAIELNSLALKANCELKVIIKLDCGMHRLGIDLTRNSDEEIISIFRLSNLVVVGCLAHFSHCTLSNVVKQGELLCETLTRLESKGFTFEQITASNGSCGINFRKYAFDGVRVGGLLYGLNTSGTILPITFDNCLRWLSNIASIKEVMRGQSVSYDSTYVCSKDSLIAVVPVGYADGYNRKLSNCGVCRVNGVNCPVVGRVCMDMFMIDVTNAGAKLHQEVILFDHQYTIEDMAKSIGTISYEVLGNISSRVERKYIK